MMSFISIKSRLISQLQNVPSLCGTAYALLGGLVLMLGSGIALAVMIVVLYFTPKAESLMTEVAIPLAHWANIDQVGGLVISQTIDLLKSSPVLVASGLACFIVVVSFAMAFPYAFAAYRFFSQSSERTIN